MNKFLKSALLSFSLVIGFGSSVWADTPQTDVAFVEQLSTKSPDEVLAALAMYYDLHVSELGVQLTKEQNTGAFFAARRATSDGDEAEAKRQMDVFEGTKAALAAARMANQVLRQTLTSMTGIAFAGDLVMAPDVPDILPISSAGISADLLSARTKAWASVEKARAHWRKMRLQLLEDQDRYEKTRKVKIGNSMRAMTQAEIAMARAACDFRMIEVEIAIATGQSLVVILSKL